MLAHLRIQVVNVGKLKKKKQLILEHLKIEIVNAGT